MNEALFDWDSANIGHIAEHDVAPEEAEEVILRNPLDIGLEVVDGEERAPMSAKRTRDGFSGL
jgi:hypothetical protein